MTFIQQMQQYLDNSSFSKDLLKSIDKCPRNLSKLLGDQSVLALAVSHRDRETIQHLINRHLLKVGPEIDTLAKALCQQDYDFAEWMLTEKYATEACEFVSDLTDDENRMQANRLAKTILKIHRLPSGMENADAMDTFSKLLDNLENMLDPIADHDPMLLSCTQLDLDTKQHLLEQVKEDPLLKTAGSVPCANVTGLNQSFQSS